MYLEFFAIFLKESKLTGFQKQFMKMTCEQEYIFFRVVGSFNLISCVHHCLYYELR